MTKIRTFKKKLRGAGYIDVDMQLVRWRKRRLRGPALVEKSSEATQGSEPELLETNPTIRKEPDRVE